MTLRTKSELVAEINRVQTALNTTTSDKLKRDYSKHLKRLKRDLRDFDRGVR